MIVLPIAATASYANEALTQALRLTGEDAERPIRARLVALAALLRSFPRQNAVQLSSLLDYPAPDAAAGALRKAREVARWWNEDWIDEVVGALVAERYGERSA